MSIDRLAFLSSYLSTLWAQARLTNRDSVVRRQDRMWRAFARVAARTPALSHLAGRPLHDFPVTLPNLARADFTRWNTLRLDPARTRQAAVDAEQGGSGEAAPGVMAGFSTGTSGARGLFVSTQTERAKYLGQAIAKLLPWSALLRSRRIALCLRADNALYRDVANAGPFKFGFFGLDTATSDLQQQLIAFDPHVFIGPSHVLVELARGGPRLKSLERLFYGAEPMNEDERGWLAGRLGVRPDPIYQATEGFLGAACSRGTLHLNEDTLIIERQPVPDTNRFQPIVTDLQRSSQPIVRFLLDDILEPIEGACPCGSALLAVRGVEGRIGDVWRWRNAVIPPRDVEEALAQAVGPDVDWRALACPTSVTLEIAGEHVAAGAMAVGSMLAQHRVAVSLTTTPSISRIGPKRRRVVWRDG